MTVVYAIMVAVMLLILLQFLLLMVAMEDFLSGSRRCCGERRRIGGCFAAACWLIRYVPGGRSADSTWQGFAQGDQGQLPSGIGYGGVDSIANPTARLAR
jgi:hypothetical protein